MSDGLLVPVDSAIHRLPAQVKLVALVIFMLGVVATPALRFWAFGLYAVTVVAALGIARIPAPTVARRLAVETPFVVFALVLPFVAAGERTTIAGVELSAAGVVGAWNILAKGTLGVLAAILLSATTAPRDLLAGLDRLRLPSTLVAILGFMIRYLSVVAADLRRMRIAREARGYAGGGAGHLKAVAAGAGALFVRSYERGERVHLAMLARGYTGTMPALSTRAATRREWIAGLTVPLAAVAVAVIAR